MVLRVDTIAIVTLVIAPIAAQPVATRTYDADGKISEIASAGTKTFGYDNAEKSDTRPYVECGLEGFPQGGYDDAFSCNLETIRPHRVPKIKRESMKGIITMKFGRADPRRKRVPVQKPIRSFAWTLSAIPICSSFNTFAADIPAQLHIDQVTVYRQGAIVTRTGLVGISQGGQRLIIKGLPAGVEAKALKVAVDSDSVHLAGVEVAKINEGQYVSELEREQRRKIEEKDDQRVAVRDEVATAEMQLKLLESLAQNPSGGPTKAAVDGANLSAVLVTMSSSAAAAHKRVREANLQLRALDREIERLKADLNKVATQSKESTEVRVALESDALTNSKVTLSYAVEDAGWQWIYEARLDTGKKHVSLERHGQVQQGSGEDWSNVELTLTTAQPSEDVATPAIGSLFLDLEQPEKEPRQNAAKAASPSAAVGGELKVGCLLVEIRRPASEAHFHPTFLRGAVPPGSTN